MAPSISCKSGGGTGRVRSASCKSGGGMCAAGNSSWTGGGGIAAKGVGATFEDVRAYISQCSSERFASA
eukprot:CAMPEP_0113385018 /NCGR_PEP_ID=MMETSP0013_2-20120614/7232_1 /TAXON_ID=2843 ORGANISM="Skeletonema costatum, Strain 1716" /NCGR_SAMPLE_ID=MMETSP0013_2 /ASSEMBLY_ACC=CAM_ASM_000158 /LENGTH=68 /DNA_ID=CAMNT_0000267725 /DNA_START=121 /DNA_END=324 /DNA_ORIENTATION=- /assembly_acc=CAM_ASM_000158